MNELVRLYESTRQKARRLPSWRLRSTVRGARRSLRQDPADESRQVTLVALEQEMRARGLPVVGPFPPRAAPRRRRRVVWRP